MNKEIKLYNSITNIDDSIISEAIDYNNPKKAVWHYIFPAAACLAVVIAAAIGVKSLQSLPNSPLPWTEGLPISTDADTAAEENPKTDINTEEIPKTNTSPEEPSRTDMKTEAPQETNPLPQEIPQSQAQINWQTPEEIIGSDSSGNMAGLFIPTFLAYNGGFYGSVSTAPNQDSRFAKAEENAEDMPFSGNYYLVENRPDCIALLRNGHFTIYQKQFDVIFEYEGKTYGIAYPAEHPDQTDLGEVLCQNENLTLYSATFYKGREYEEKQLVVDILPMLRARNYEIFKEDYDENGEPIHYMDAWWVVKPIN